MKWVEALESGKFKQGLGRLRRGNQFGKSYCCLGVADKIFKLKVKENAGQYGNVFCDFLGISKENESKYMGMNDREIPSSSGCSFKEIAAEIRKDYNLGASPVSN